MNAVSTKRRNTRTRPKYLVRWQCSVALQGFPTDYENGAVTTALPQIIWHQLSNGVTRPAAQNWMDLAPWTKRMFLSLKKLIWLELYCIVLC